MKNRIFIAINSKPAIHYNLWANIIGRWNFLKAKDGLLNYIYNFYMRLNDIFSCFK